jgi:hypothetical protein
VKALLRVGVPSENSVHVGIFVLMPIPSYLCLLKTPSTLGFLYMCEIHDIMDLVLFIIIRTLFSALRSYLFPVGGK